ncbi:hypothetical protein CspHIS471_0702900 [Cutaneotrichosporon sp. HIS471]|nr:hypothetical protein CspHIS471_0702900 [Cutaneotrichosporon sp. HIS471]
MGLVVWTDASRLINRPTKDMGIGIYWGEGRWASSLLSGERPPPGLVTNHQAEFYAVIRAIELHPDPRVRLEVRTDSMHAIRHFQNHEVWGARNWRKRPHGSKLAVKSQQDIVLLKRLRRALSALTFKVSVTYVRGHSTDRGNNKADALAKAAARGNLIIKVSDNEIEVIEISDDEGEDEEEEMGEDHEVIVISDSDEGYETCDDEDDDGGDDSDDESDDSDDEREEELHGYAYPSKRRRLA